MCGIFGIVQSNKSAPEMVFRGLKDIEYRGYDSWGIGFIRDGKIVVKKDTGFLPETFNSEESVLAIGHTRWATHGGVTIENAHPHTDCDSKIVLVHNGILENYQQLRKELIEHEFRSQTDTEVIVHLIEEKQKSRKLGFFEACNEVFKMLEGLNAVVVTNGLEIVAFKKGSPMVLGKLDEGYAIASDSNALLPHTKKLYFVEDNEVLRLTEEDVKLWELNGKRKDFEFRAIKWSHQQADKGAFEHYLLKEISEQPINILKLTKDRKSLVQGVSMINEAFGTYFIGCGTASYAALLGTYLFAKFAKKHVNFSIGSEFTYLEDFITSKSLLVAISQSGETIDVIEPVQLAKSKNAKVMAITNVEGSSLFRLADESILLQSGVEKAVLGTKSFTAMVSILIRLVYELIDQSAEGKKILTASAAEITRILDRQGDLEKLAQQIMHSEHLFILGRGLSYPIALETALKIKESSYIHAEGFAAGELKHGVIALIEKGTPVIVFVPEDETKDAVLSNAMEVKARGAYVIGVSAKNNEIFDYFFEVADVGCSSVLPNTVFAQLLGYYLTLALGRNPDKPRNLAKSVVVR